MVETPARMAAVERAFLEDIIANPADDTPRLIYADWLDDCGEASRARFIRVQCELAGLDRDAPGSAGREIELATMERNVNLNRFRERLGVPSVFSTSRRQLYWQTPLACLSRGFVTSVHCEMAQWLEHGHAIAAVNPIERVATDREPLLWQNRQGTDHTEYIWIEGDSASEKSMIDSAVFDCFSQGCCRSAAYGVRSNIITIVPFVDKKSAVAALSDACITWARLLE